MKNIAKFLFLFTCFAANLQAEIESITIKWTALECQKSCIAGLERYFRNINGVADVQMDQPGGQAVLRWKPNVQLTFMPINNAMQMIGLSINDLRIKVRGTISHDERSVTLNSTGDNTRFLLMSVATPKTTVMTEEFNPQTHILSPAQREEFLDAQAADQVAVVEGPIFEPERSPPLKVLVEKVRFEKPEHPAPYPPLQTEPVYGFTGTTGFSGISGFTGPAGTGFRGY